MILNGDAKTHQHLSPLNVYGELKMTKEECINHIANILGSDLCKNVTEWRSKRVTLGRHKEGSFKKRL